MQGDFQERGLVAAFCLVPVYDLEPGFYIGGAGVFVLQIIGVLPEIEIEDGNKPFRERRVLIGQRKQIQLSPPVGGQPEPAGAEKLQGCLEENFVEGFPGVEIQKKGVLFESKKLYDSQLPGFVQSYLRRKGVAMEPGAVMMVCECVGNDLSRLSGELDKLLLALPEGEKRIRAAFVESHVGISKDFNNFELVAALVAKDVLKVNRIVKYFNDNPKNFSLQLTLSVVFGFFSNLMVAYYAPQRTEEGIADWVELPRWQVARNIIPAMRNYSGVKVLQIIEKLRETDAKSKGLGNVSTSPGELLKELAYFILH